MINLDTGRIDFNGIVIKPDFKLGDFKKYFPEKVDITERENGRGIVCLKHSINSNGINAEITIYIDEKFNFREVVIFPILEENGDKNLLESSKQWLKGCAKGSYKEDSGSICGSYKWGYISALYAKNRDFGTIGGEIIIRYGN